MADITTETVTVADLPPLNTMTDRELMEEMVTHLRAVAATVEELSASPMLKALQGGSNPLMAMLGR